MVASSLSDAAATLRPSTPSRSSSEDRGVVWPGVSALFQQQHAQSAPLLGGSDDPSKLKAGFSFDWNRGRSASAKSEKSSAPFLSAFGGYGEGLPFTSRQRWKHFIALLLASGLMFMLAGAFLPLVLLRPQKFCLFFTLGSMLSMASFAVLRGPLAQLKHMFSMQRLPFTSAYVGSMALTLYAALVLHSYFLVLIFSLVQACAVAWYLLSYVPGGAPILKLVTRSTLRVMAALCCRGASSSGWGGGGSGSPPALLSWGSSRSNSMLPL